MTFGQGFIVIDKSWADFKAIASLKGCLSVIQYETTAVAYVVFFIDDKVVYRCTIFTGTVPPNADQTQNDADKSDFVTNYAPAANRSMVPRTSDGKPVILPNLFPGFVTLYLTGQGDHIANNTYGDGQEIQLTKGSSGDVTCEWQFLDWVYIAGGGLTWRNAELGDYISLQIYAPATSVSASDGGNTGNCNIVNSVVIVPAAGNGTHNVTLANATLVPADANEAGIGTGYWDWTEPLTGKGTITASATPGAAKFHLLTVQQDLARFVNRLSLVGSSSLNITVPAVKPKKILPHWKFKATLHHSGGLARTLEAGCYLVAARFKTM